VTTSDKMYLVSGDEVHIELIKRAYAWHEHVRKRELDPRQLETWQLMAASWTRAGRPMHYRPGWPDAWLPDGSSWGRVTAYKMIPWFPVSEQMKKKYGGLIHRSETVFSWAKQTPPEFRRAGGRSCLRQPK